MEKHPDQSEIGYISRNRTSGDCELVAVANAYRYFTGTQVEDELYDELVDKTGCRHGSVINIDPAYQALDIKVKRWWPSWSDFATECWETENQALVDNLPLAITVRHPKYGSHYVLAVEYNKEVDAVKVWNFDCGPTSSRRWIFKCDLDTYASLADQLNLGERRVLAYVMDVDLAAAQRQGKTLDAPYITELS